MSAGRDLVGLQTAHIGTGLLIKQRRRKLVFHRPARNLREMRQGRFLLPVAGAVSVAVCCRADDASAYRMVSRVKPPAAFTRAKS